MACRAPRATVLLFSWLTAVVLIAASCSTTRPLSDAARAQEEPSPPAEAAAPDTAPTGTLLLADDAASANPALVPVPFQAADGLSALRQTVSLPPGFSISVLATGLPQPRFMAFDDAGNLLVALQRGSVVRVPAGGGSPGQAILTQLNAPSSLAFHDGYLYVGETNQVSRYPYDPSGPLGPAEVVVPNLPTGGHSTRTVAFGPDGALYVSVGSSCNICVERDERRAAVLRYAADGSGYERFAWGLRNAVGLAFQPGTGLLWVTVNERDNQGNDIPPDLVTAVQAGQNFGWPACRPPDATPQEPGNDCSGVTPPTVGIQAHSAPLGLAFYTGAQFPADYQGDLFVAQHGSWNRQPPAEPKLLRIHFQDGRPVSAQDFATGWQDAAGGRWGRPAGVIVAPDGSLVVSDDQAGALYRISYVG